MIERFSLNAFKFFYYVASYGSVTIASEKLYVTQGAVSRQIKNLEDSLNTALFERKGKSLVITPEGNRLLDCCHSIFHQLEICLIDIKKSQTVTENLLLSCEPTICMKWLIPRLNKFNSLDYNFGINLITGGGTLDFKQQNVDLALRRNDFVWGEHIYSEKICEELMFFVKNPEDTIDKFNKILISSSRDKFWKTLKQNKFIRDYIINFTHTELDHFYLCIEGCLSGLGPTIVSGYMIEKELKNKFLIPNTKPFLDDSYYFLLSAEKFEQDDRKIIFRDWLISEMQNSKNNLLQLYG